MACKQLQAMLLQKIKLATFFFENRQRVNILHFNSIMVYIK